MKLLRMPYAISLQRSARIDNLVEFLHDLIDVVSITVAWDETSVEDLKSTIKHPGTGSTLGMASQILLEDTQESVALCTTKMFQLLTNNIGFVLVVGDGGRSMEGGDAEIINGQAPGCESTSKRSNCRILLPEVVAEAELGLLFLSLGFT